MKPKILVIIATTRQERKGNVVADWYMAQAKAATAELEFELFDLAELRLPVFNEPAPPMSHQYTATQKKIEDALLSADGFVFITGEYNHSIPGSLKNFLDYTYYGWQRKVAAYVSYGSAAAGVRAVEHLIPVMTFFNVASLVQQVNIRNIHMALDDHGAPRPDYALGDIAKQIEELSWWAKTLRAGRQQA